MQDEAKVESDAIRQLKWRLKQANKTIGSQGQTIHLLRSELSEVREINGKVARGDIRRLERENQDLLQDSLVLMAENAALRQKMEVDQRGDTPADETADA